MGKVKNFPPYEEAKRIANKAGIKSREEYNTKYKELGLPSAPNNTYEGKGWIDWPSFLGKETIVFPPYEGTKMIVMENGIKSVDEYKTKYKELGLPSAPNNTYEGKGWIDWPSFLGKETIVFPPYEKAHEAVMVAGIKRIKEYKLMNKQLGLPSAPDSVYKGKGWIDWPSFFGKETIVFPPYEGTKMIVMENGIKSKKEYKTKYKELGLPSAPNNTYEGKGWIDWASFLGKETIVFPPYEGTKMIVMENGIKSKEEYKTKYKELGLPSAPNNTYEGKGWIDWADFLGKPHKITPMERKTKVLSKLALNPILLGDKAPLQIIYMLASNWDKDLADEIELLLTATSFEERLDWVKEQLKTLKVDTSTTPDATSEKLDGEIPAMESMLEIFEDSMDDLPDEVSTNIKAILENYYHNVINKELIEEFDD